MAVVVATLVICRSQPATDAVAARLDADANLAGELRSAWWFASAEAPDEWTAFHLEQAAGRGSQVDWRTVYAPVAYRRAWLATAALSLAAFLVPVGVPLSPSTEASVPSAAENLAAAVELEALPPEVLERVLELLARVESGAMSPEDALARLRELSAFAKLETAVQKKLADLLRDAARGQRGTDVATSSPEQAGEMSEDVKWARENMAARLANEEAQRRESGEDGANPEQSEGASSTPLNEQAANGEAGEANAGKTGARVPIKAAQSPGRRERHDAPQPARLGWRSRLGLWREEGSVRYGTSDASAISAAFKREMIEANVNIDRSDLRNEERRQRTEQSWSALRYTRVAGRSTFDRVRADAPRLVPEARRPLVERYFVREAPATIRRRIHRHQVGARSPAARHTIVPGNQRDR